MAPANRRAAGPWSSLDLLVGRPVGQSGLLVTSVVAVYVRNLLGADFPDNRFRSTPLPWPRP